jgi:alkyl hydroperoxide reductase subunit AhpC
MIQVGKQVPNFTVKTVLGTEQKTVSLSDYAGKWVVLFFYPADFTFICPTEITEFSKRLKAFREKNAVVLGGSTDSVHAHMAWLPQLGKLEFPLFSDQTQALSRMFGVLVEEEGVALRATFIIDDRGVLRSSYVNDLNIGRSVNEILRTLEALQTGDFCPVEWSPGEKTLGR